MLSVVCFLFCSMAWGAKKIESCPGVLKAAPRVMVTDDKILLGNTTLAQRSNDSRAKRERLFLRRLLQTPGKIVSYDTIVQFIEPAFGKLSFDEKVEVAHSTSVDLRWALRQADPKFDSIQEVEPRGFFWGDVQLHSKILLERGHLRVTEHQVYWKGLSISAFSMGPHARRERKLLLALLNADPTKPFKNTKILEAAWPEHLGDLRPVRLSLAHASMASMYEDFIRIDPMFRDLKKLSQGYFWRSALARTQDGLNFDPSINVWFYRGKILPLRPGGAALLGAMISAPDGFRTRLELIQVLPGCADADVNPQTLRSLKEEIKYLREAFLSEESDFDSLLSVPGEGYVFIDKIL